MSATATANHRRLRHQRLPGRAGARQGLFARETQALADVGCHLVGVLGQAGRDAHGKARLQ
jgi:hypothetical protein